jgi:UDP-GlcNAc:undecaprenyl-phosphate GlcNAc-1-phosphate transferase
MKSYALLFASSFLLALGFTPLVRRLALGWGAVDLPDETRRIHQEPTARLGGLAIFAASLICFVAVPLLNNIVSQSLSNNWDALSILFVPATMIFLLGVYDDFRGLSAPVKLGVQILAAAFLYSNGFTIKAISLPFGASLEFPLWLGFPLTALWIVGVTNAFNLIDGIDGLAAGASVFALLTLFVSSLMQGHPEVCLVSIILVGAVLGFLRYNFNPATIFLGDSGSLFLGFMCAALSLTTAQKGSTIVAVAIPVVAFGLPITEAWLSITRRFLTGTPLFQSDRRHIHHMLLERGLSQRQAVSLLYLVCGFFSLFGILLLNPQRNATALIFLVLAVGIFVGVRHLRYDEFSEVGRQLKQGYGFRRRDVAFNLRVRQASASLRAAHSYEELSQALNQFFAVNEFAYALLEVYSTRQAGANVVLPEASEQQFLAQRHLPNAVEWTWSWQNDETALAAVQTSPQFWSLRVPLAGEQGQALGAISFYRDIDAGLPVDLTGICGELRAELSAVLERLRAPECHELLIEPASLQFSLSHK